MSEHRLERCLGVADRVLALAGGRIVCDATPERVPAVGARPRAGARDAGCTRTGRGRPAADPGGASRPPGPPRRGVAAGAGGRSAPGTAPTAPRLRLASRFWSWGRETRRESPAPPLSRPPGDEAAAGGGGLALEHVWYEIPRGPTILRDVSFSLTPGERVALMGRNGAGKSTLLRHRGRPRSADARTRPRQGRVALLLQNPTDYLIHDTVAEEARRHRRSRPSDSTAELAPRHPRDLSGGEKQRLALAIVARRSRASCSRPCVALDEPTRGMDRGVKDDLADLLGTLPARAVIVATHDPEFVAAFADRVVLLGDGTLIADGPRASCSPTASYFATETARILGGAGGALLPDDAAR